MFADLQCQLRGWANIENKALSSQKKQTVQIPIHILS